MSETSPPGSDESGPDYSNPPPGKDCFAPPHVPCECYCLHCNRVFMSDGIWFQKVVNARDGFDGFWMCPTPNCSGAGFTFDIFPTDPHHPDNEGWSDTDGEEIVFDEEDEEIESVTREYDPSEPSYAELDEIYGDEEDDLEGEEWKHGLAPGERPPEPPWAQRARTEWEEEQKKYDAPDQRPREIDWSDRTDISPPPRHGDKPDGDIGDDDIPF